MSSIDRRVVEAEFDNGQFQRGIKDTLNSLDQLKRGLNVGDAGRGLSTLSAAAERVSNRFNVMRVAAYTAIATIAHQATIAGEQFVKSFTIGPLLDGFHEYETQLNSVQTILANTKWQHKDLQDVNAALNELNHYSDKTIYNFTEMARNIGTFTAAGVGLDKSVASIKGIANLAAVSGSNSQQASTAMYQLSQAISSGTVKLMDWNSVVNAGMGGKVFQDSLMETARVHGVEIDKMIKKEGSFRNTLQEGWLTSKILTETLSKFTGDLSREQLKQMGYTEKQIDGIIKMGKTATDAATKVKTFTQLMGTLKEAAGSGWAKTWQIIIGNFNQAKRVWTNVSNVLGGALQSAAKARNNVLKDWADLGGRKAMIDGISNAFKALMSVLSPIRDAFREIFPRKTGEQLAAMTKSFRDFMANLKIGAETADNLKRTFAGFFAVLDIGWQVIKAGIKFVYDLFSAITEGEGSGGFLGATANIGDFLVALDNAIKKGKGLTKFFDGLANAIRPVIEFVKQAADAIFSIFDFDAPSAEKITQSLSPLETFGRMLSAVWGHLLDFMRGAFRIGQKVGSKIAEIFSGLGSSISDAFGGINWEDVLHTINTGLLAGTVLLFRKFVKHFTDGGDSPVSGLVDAIKGPFGELTNTLKSMQQTLRAATLLEIAAAIGIMTLSVIGLSKIDEAGLRKALTAMTVMFGQLFGSLIVFEKIGGAQGLIATSTGLIVFATAVRVLVSSVKALSDLSWEELAKGISGVTALIGGLVLATRGIGSNAAGMISAGAGLILLATGVRILVSSVTELSGLSWGDMAKGLTGVAAMLTALGLYSKFAGANGAGIVSGAGIILLATGIKILAGAAEDFGNLAWGSIAKGLTSIAAILALFAAFSKGVGNPIVLIASGAALILISIAMGQFAKVMQKFGGFSWGEIAKGMVSMAGALTLISLAMNAMPPSSLLSAAALIGVAIAMGQIAKALGQMGGMSWGEIAKGLVTLAGSLVIISAAMYAMSSALPGAAALLVVATALRIFTPVLMALSGLSWNELIHGMVGLAATFAIIGVAGAVLTPLVPTLLALGAAIALIGVGVALAGAGILALSAGLTALAAAGVAGTAAIVGLVSGIIGILPQLGKGIALLVVGFAQSISKAGPAILKALVTVLDSLLKAIIKETPKILKAFDVLITGLLKEAEKLIPRMADAALKTMLGIIKAIDKEAPKIIRAIAKMLVDMLNAMTAKIPDLVTAASNLLVAFLKGIAKHLGDVIDAGTDIVIAWIKGIGRNGVKIANATLDMIVKFINGLATAIDSHVDDFRDAGMHMAGAIINGMTLGLAGKAAAVAGKAVGVAKGAVGAVTGFLGIGSPSKVFYEIGKWVSIGLAYGIDAYGKVATEAAKHLVNHMLQGVNDELRHAVKYIIFDLPAGLVGPLDEVNQTLADTKDVLRSAVHDTHNDMQTLAADIKDLKKGRDDDAKSVRDHTEAVSDAKKKLSDLQNAKKQDHDAILQAQRDLRDARESLDDATKAQKQHEKAIDDDTKALHRANKEHEVARAALTVMNDQLDKQKSQLRDLGKQYDSQVKSIEKATKALEDAIKTRDDYAKQIYDQYSSLPDIVKETEKKVTDPITAALGEIKDDTQISDYVKSVTDQTRDSRFLLDALNSLRDQFGLSDELYKNLLAKGPSILPFVEQLVSGGQLAVDQINQITLDADAAAQALSDAVTPPKPSAVDPVTEYTNTLTDQVEDTQKFIDDMNALRDQFHLSDALYQKLLAEGPAILPFVEALLSSGQSAVDQLNTLTAQLDEEAKQLGVTASTSLYQAGVNMAQSIVDGFKEEKHKIVEEMEDIAKAIGKALRKALKISSPSQVMVDIGVNTILGLLNGLKSMHSAIEKEGSSIASRLSGYIQQITDKFDGSEMSPVITPVLDLSAVENDIRAIGSMGAPVSVNTSLQNAAAASSGLRLVSTTLDNPKLSGDRNVTFIQNNISPKALSSADIYRQTNNQISKAKGALTKDVA